MRRYWIIPFLIALLVSFGCSGTPPNPSVEPSNDNLAEPNTTQTLARTPNLADGPERIVRSPHPVSLSDLHHKYRSTFVLSGPPQKRAVALSFDDAPDADFTPKVLDALKEANVKATFFIVGNRVETHPEVMERIVREGHAIGNHSYNHANLPKLSDADFREQVLRTDRIIKQHTGYAPMMIRPPYGNINEEQIKWLASQKKKVINWNVDSLDWKGLTAKQVATNILSNIKPGSIVLQHSGGGEGEDLTGTVEAIPEIVTKLRDDNVELITIPELLDLPEPQSSVGGQAKSDDLRYPEADQVYGEE